MKLFEHLEATLELPEHEAMLVESVRALCRDKIAPRAADYDRDAKFPWENIEDINALGLNAMFIPEEYGGAGMSYAAYLECVREISKACASTGIIWATNFHAVKPIVDLGTHEQKERFLPKVAEGAMASLCITEPTAGSDATGMRTRFTPDGDDIIVDGGKIFISNGDVSSVFLLFGKWSEIDDDKKSISVLVFEKEAPGFSVGRKEDKMGHRAASTVAINFDQMRVPRANLIGKPGEGLKILLASLNKSRPSVAAQALGIARAAFEDSVAYINERKQGGRKIIDFQGIQFMVADMATDLALCEAWLWHVARMVDGGAADFSVESSLLKMRASDVAVRIATDAVQLHGGYGYTKDFRVERLFRDAKLTQIWEGTNQIHRQYIGRTFLTR
ncbi:MAG: acyl-CoA dehydrogenase family protein [Alphaproteobacteria bacterium]